MKKELERLLVPMTRTTAAFWILVIVLLIGVIAWLYAWGVQLSTGLVVTGLRNIPGAPWGMYISNFIWWIGVAHGGIAVAAAVYVLRLEKYRVIARIGEVLTLFSLMVAGLSIVFDMGRPDRVWNLITQFWDRVGYSPLQWDVAVITLYSILTLAFIWITIREDLHATRERFPRLRWLYDIVLFGYKPDEKAKVEQIAWWLSLAILALICLLSGGVIPWIFGLMPARPGWYTAFQGPYFLIAAIASALAAMIILAALFRKLYAWQDYIRPELIRGLSSVLAVFLIFYFWLMLQEQLTIRYHGTVAELAVSNAVLFGGFAPVFWTALTLLLVSFIYLAAQAIRPGAFTISGSVIASIFVLIALWLKRFLIIVPSLTHPYIYPPGVYIPTWVEYTLVLGGTFFLFTLCYAVFVKLFPIVPVAEVKKE